MKITQEMIDDWCSPEGYSDFRDWDIHKNKLYTYQDGLAIVRGDQYAIEARENGSRGELNLIPMWVYGREDGIIDFLERTFVLADPEFDLDEIHAGQELVNQRG